LENSPLFNAGFGAVLNADGECEMDAAIMEGSTLAAGSVAALRQIRSPISLARSVLEKSPHVFLVGAGAERFAQEGGFDLVANTEFRTKRRIRELERVRRLEEERGGGAGVSALQERMIPESDESAGSPEKWGTVGCVALDRLGNLAAGTSTGGITNKKFGRVGDSPIIGAGTYANNETAAVSCTGHGEYFIRSVVAYDVSARMQYGGESLQRATEAALAKAKGMGGVGGMIAMDRQGHVAMPFNTPGMYRGFKLSDGSAAVELYGS
jgi:beta-aspartyl-peptidase (threonine type)